MASMETDMAVSKFEEEDYDLLSGIEQFEQYEPPSSALLAQTTFFSVSIKLDPALFIDLSAVQEHLDRVCVLADLVRAAHTTVDQHEARIQHELTELWDNNQDIRKRGLRGGTARKQRRAIGNYIPIATVERELSKRRVEVERIDYLGRNRVAGLRALRIMFEEAFCFLRDQQHQCEDILRCGEILMYGVTTPLVLDHLGAVDEVFTAENLDKIDDIAEMLDNFDEEYDTSL
ncbi:uncharacterized protein Z520_12375 [Fonsecaea multimorphosa CBS 102226]|uniref:Uncharacterized protein n=1 Tax=Fonsecaea multimorphosa CBS 102226 TaxID=1442371 RepID=A0A0D2JFH6_9EURO|nr:uncharacterized protein Z520_12375 [Fonsecaea multimorphosa CBS 102226]KIX91912.1 hypothetical protein Z520_12375 [Fonsecaea multimorphosa CBS 102226]OAL19183.1 hypothetical protein AYO22_09944 [Fonsecaea multimorphosa]